MTLQEGATVEEAIRASGLLELRTDIDLTKTKSAFTAVRQNSAILCMMAIGWRFIVLSLPIRKSFAGNEQKNQRINNRQKKVLIEHLLTSLRATLLLVTTQRRFVINVGQHTATVKGQRQRLLRYTFMTGLLAEDIEPCICTKWIGHQRCTQCVRNLLLRHANTYFGYVVSGQIVPRLMSGR